MPETPRKIGFPPEAELFFGPAVKDLERIAEIFGAVPFEEVERNPAILVDLCIRGQPYIEAATKAFRRFFNLEVFGIENPSRDRVPKINAFDAILRAAQMIEKIYPEFGDESAACTPLIAINPIYYSIVSEFIARMYLHKDRPKINRTLTAMAEPLLRGTTHTERIPATILEIVSDTDFFNQHPLSLRNLDHLLPQDLRAMSERIFGTIQRAENPEVPLAVSFDDELCHNPILITSDGIDSKTAKSGFYLAEFSLYDPSLEKTLTDPESLERMRLHGGEGLVLGKTILAGKQASFFVGRAHGDLEGFGLSSDALKILFGEKWYEVLRAYLLFRHAQLVCDEETVTEELGDLVTAITPNNHRPGPISKTGDAQAAAPPSSAEHIKGRLPMRFFPQASRPSLNRHPRSNEARESRESGTGRHLRGRRTEKHRRLLPAGWKPTADSWEKAKAARVNLLTSFEIVYELTTDAESTIFTRQEMLDRARVGSLNFETYIQSLGDQVRQRHFTYVAGHEFGEVPEVVRAEFRFDLNRAAGVSAADNDPDQSSE